MPTLAKLTRPRLHDVVVRERLFALIDEARSRCPVLFVSGPPGSGKSTLLASYLGHSPCRHIWYQLDAGDNDAPAFFHYLTIALGAPRARRVTTLGPLTPEYLGDLTGYARRYFREYFSRLGSPAMVVLDNYHELEADTPLHRMLDQAIREIPDGVSMMVLSRHSLPSSWTALLAEGRLACLDPQDLRLTWDEARAIAGGHRSADIASLESLYRTTDGWAAGWRLILENAHRLETGITDLHGDALTSIFNYFSSQLFQLAAPDTQAFLKQTAVLPRMTVSIARDLTGHASTQELLDTLYHRGLFTDRRGVRPYRYHYHDLFRSFLLDQLMRSHTPPEVHEIQRHAAELLEASDQTEDAVTLYLAAQDWRHAMRSITSCAEDLIGQGRGQTLRDWIGALPAEVRDGSPWIIYWFGLSLMSVAPTQARQALEKAYGLFLEARDDLGKLCACAGVVHSYRFEFKGFLALDPWIDILESLLTHHDGKLDPVIEVRATGALVFALDYRRPYPHRLRPHVDRMKTLIGTEGMPADEVAAAARILVQHFMIGFEFQSGRRFVEQVDALLADQAPTPVNLAFWRTGIGFLCWWEGDLAAAELAFAHSQRICGEYAIALPATRLYNLYGQALIACERGELANAESLRGQAHQHADSSNRNDQYHDDILLMRLAVLRQDFHTAIAACRRMVQLSAEVGWIHLRRDSLIALACLLAEVGEYDETRECLRLANELVGQFGSHPVRADILLLTGYCAGRQGDRAAWRMHLIEAMKALKSGEDRAGLRERSKLACIAYGDALEQCIEPEYVTRIIRRYRLGAPEPDIAGWPWPIKVLTLGQFRILVNDEPLAFARKMPKKPLQLLKALIALGGTDVPEQELADTLWPDEGGDVAVSACETTLVRLRRLLRDPRAILQRGGCLTLNRDLVWVDALALAQRWGRTALTGQAAREALPRVIGLYRGDFLPGDVDQPWSIARRERLRAGFVRALAEVGRQDEDAGELDAAISLYRQGLEADAFVEEFHRGLMRCHGKREEYAEALGVHHRLRKALAARLGIPPSPATERLAAVLMEAALRGEDAPDMQG